MNFEQVNAICLSLSGAKRQDQLGQGVCSWTVDGRVFATMAEGAEQISLRCADATVAQLLVDHGRAGKLPNLPHGTWVTLELSINDFELNCRVMESYEMVRADGD